MRRVTEPAPARNVTWATSRWVPRRSGLGLTFLEASVPSVRALTVPSETPSSTNFTLAIRRPATLAVNALVTHPEGPRRRAAAATPATTTCGCDGTAAGVAGGVCAGGVCVAGGCWTGG